MNYGKFRLKEALGESRKGPEIIFFKGKGESERKKMKKERESRVKEKRQKKEQGTAQIIS